MKEVKGPTILTIYGDYFRFDDFKKSPIRITDIAWALSNVCRFGGHCKKFYSVAQHSVLVSLVERKQLPLKKLLHDGSEAYLGDMVKPLKEIMPEFQNLESGLEDEIYSRFGLEAGETYGVKRADLILLATEQRDLMNNKDPWTWTAGIPKLKKKIKPMLPRTAYHYFLSRYYQIIGCKQLEVLHWALCKFWGVVYHQW